MTFPLLTPLEVLQQGGNVFNRIPKYVVRFQLLENVERHFNLVNDFGLPGSGSGSSGAMTTPVFAIFAADADFYAAYYNTATLPADNTDVLDGSAADHNPNQRYIPKECLNISFKAAQETNVTILFFAN